MSVYDSLLNDTHLIVSYLVYTSESAPTLRGWSLVADPAVMGPDLLIDDVTATRLTADGSTIAVQPIPYTQSQLPTVTFLDDIAAGASVLYALVFPRRTTTTSVVAAAGSSTSGGGGGSQLQYRHHRHQHRRQRRHLAEAGAPGTGASVVVWSNDAASSTALPSDVTGPGSEVLAAGGAACAAAAPLSADANLQLFGPHQCLTVTVSRAFSAAANRSVITVHLRANDASAASATAAAAAPVNCSAWLSTLPRPAFLRLLLAPTAAVELATAPPAPAATPSRSPLGVFLQGSALVLPRGALRSGRYSDMALTFALPGVITLADVCAPAALAGQLPDTCALQLVTTGVCEADAVGLSAGGGAPVGGAPQVNVPPPPAFTLRGSEDPMVTPVVNLEEVSESSGLTNSQIAIIVCLVVGFFLIAVITAALLLHHRRKRWQLDHAEPPPPPADGNAFAMEASGRHVISMAVDARAAPEAAAPVVPAAPAAPASVAGSSPHELSAVGVVVSGQVAVEVAAETRADAGSEAVEVGSLQLRPSPTGSLGMSHPLFAFPTAVAPAEAVTATAVQPDTAAASATVGEEGTTVVPATEARSPGEQAGDIKAETVPPPAAAQPPSASPSPPAPSPATSPEKAPSPEPAPASEMQPTPEPESEPEPAPAPAAPAPATVPDQAPDPAPAP